MTEGSRAPEPAPFQDKVLLLLCRMVWCDIAADWAKTVMPGVETLYWDPGEPWPSTIDAWEGDWLISFRGDLIVPEEIYGRARKGALNFHPAPPRYRGLGSQFYAIYNGDTEFGTTCHHLAPSVDTGSIIRVDTFPIAPGETATSLRHHVGAYSLMQFFEIVTDHILPGKPLPDPQLSWGDRLYTNKGLRTWMAEKKAADPDHRAWK